MVLPTMVTLERGGPTSELKAMSIHTLKNKPVSWLVRLSKTATKKLGFMGGMAVPAVVRFGYGFVQGAEYAAKEMGISDIEIIPPHGNFASPKPRPWRQVGHEAGTEGLRLRRRRRQLSNVCS